MYASQRVSITCYEQVIGTCHASLLLSITQSESDDAYSGWNSTVPLLPPLLRAT